MFDEINVNRARKRGSRDDDTLNNHPQTKRKYVLRGRVVHSCGRRMTGDTKASGVAYYLCWPRKNNRATPHLHPGLPASIRLREDELLEAICRFYADRLFGPERRAILEVEQGSIDDHAVFEREAERTRRQKLLATITRQQDSIMRQAREGDPGDPFTRGLRESYNDLESQKKVALSAIAELDTADQKAAPIVADLSRTSMRFPTSPCTWRRHRGSSCTSCSTSLSSAFTSTDSGAR